MRSVKERFDVDMSLKGVCELIHQVLAVFGVVHLKDCQAVQPLSAAESVQPEPAPAAVVQQAMEIGANHGSLMLLPHPADRIRWAQGLNSRGATTVG